MQLPLQNNAVFDHFTQNGKPADLSSALGIADIPFCKLENKILPSLTFDYVAMLNRGTKEI
jgi:hypothetical protein